MSVFAPWEGGLWNSNSQHMPYSAHLTKPVWRDLTSESRWHKTRPETWTTLVKHIKKPNFLPRAGRDYQKALRNNKVCH